MKITAHSGCDDTPMNSKAYLEHAVQLPVDALEIDIRRAADGTLILTHDAADDGSQLLLKDAFAIIAPSSLKVNCDLKEYRLEEDVLVLAQEAGIAKERILFSGSVWAHEAGEWPEYLDPEQIYLNIEELDHHIYDSLEQGGLPEQQELEQAVELCVETGCKVINVNYRICTPAFMTCCAEHGIGVSEWTPSTEEDLKKAVALEPVNITSRRPLLAKQIVAQTAER